MKSKKYNKSKEIFDTKRRRQLIGQSVWLQSRDARFKPPHYHLVMCAVLSTHLSHILFIFTGLVIQLQWLSGQSSSLAIFKESHPVSYLSIWIGLNPAQAQKYRWRQNKLNFPEIEWLSVLKYRKPIMMTHICTVRSLFFF